MDDQIVDIIEIDFGGGLRLTYEVKRPKYTPEGIEAKPSNISINMSINDQKEIDIDGDWNGKPIKCVSNSIE